MLSAVLLAASCLSDDTDNNFTYYNDTAITSFTLGTLKRVVYTKAKSTFDDNGNPKDSSYTAELDGSAYKFSIDQLAGKIYNTDSLPKGTDTTKVVCNVYSKKSGTIVIKDAGSDTLRFYNKADSINFGQEREFQVYTTDGTAHRKYMVKINVHSELPDSFAWRDRGNQAAFAAATDMRATAFGERMLVMTTDGSQTTIRSTATTDGATWNVETNAPALDAEAYKNTAVKNGTLYMISGGKLLETNDLKDWTTTDMDGANKPIKLFGAAKTKLYGLTADGNITASSDNGRTWTAEQLADEDGKAFIPTENISMASVTTETDKDAERLIITGTRDLGTHTADTAAMVWNKIEEYADGSHNHKWMLLNEENKYRMPALANLQTPAYGGKIIALGGKGQGGSTAKGFGMIYSTQDNGLTWHCDKLIILPESFSNGNSNVFATATDKENCLWIICGNDGKVWRGRLNRLGWKDNDLSFTE